MTTNHIRRARGAGSIRQRTKGSWQVRYDSPPDESGKLTKISETVRGSRRDAERVLRERLGMVESGAFVPETKETVGEFMQKWHSTYCATNTSLRTQLGYRHYMRRHIIPTLGSTPLQRLTASQIQGMYGAMLDRGLSARTVLHCHRVLRQALGHAVKWGQIPRNPADAATPPRPQSSELASWDAETFHKFLKAAGKTPFKDFYHLAVLTGMRRSELCGLTWADIDMDVAELRVVRTLQRIDGRGLVEGQPKNKRSRRTIALSDSALEVLRRIGG